MTTSFNPAMYQTAVQVPYSYNAVKIDIHNPAVNAQPQMQQPVIYDYPTAPIYPQNEVSEVKQS